mgnify:CR=1 FL=1
MKVYIKFITLIFIKSLLFVTIVMSSLVFILNLLSELTDYNFYYKVLRTSDYNIPQRRDRIYFG